MNILITGATGFIGRHLVMLLAQDYQHRLFCLIRKTSNIASINLPGIVFIQADITDKASLESDEFKKVRFDAIYHCAAIVDNTSLKKLIRVNVEGTRNICELTVRLNIPELIYISSVAVVSGNTQIPLLEDSPYSSTNNYGYSKLLAEKLVQEYRRGIFSRKNVHVAILRPPIVYGPDESHLMPLMLKLLRWRLLPILNGGEQRLHMVYVETLAKCLVECLYDKRYFEGEFFIADKDALRVEDIFTIMAKAVGTKPRYLSGPLCKIILSFPYAGKKIGFFLKDRVYSTQTLQRLGFEESKPVSEALLESCFKLAQKL